MAPNIPVTYSLVICSLAASFITKRVAPNLLLLESVWVTASTLSVVLLSSYAIYTVFLYPFYLSPLLGLPQPPGGHPILGQYLRVSKDPSGDPHREWVRDVKNDGLIWYRSLFNSARILPTSPEALREVLSGKSYEFIKTPRIMEELKFLVGQGLIVVQGDEHRAQRKSMMPSFSYRHIKELYPVFWDKTRDLISALDKHLVFDGSQNEKNASCGVIEASGWMSRATLDIIGVATMGKSFHALEDENNDLYRTYQKVIGPIGMGRFLNIVSVFLPRWFMGSLPIKRNKDKNHGTKVIKRFCRSMIREKKEAMEKGKKVDVDTLSVALNSGSFTDEGLVDQLMTFLAAGHETTATIMIWALLSLGQHPDVQRKLRAETQAALPSIRDTSSTVTAQEVENLPYLNAVTAEILRLRPPVPFTIREAVNDDTILGHRVPAGTSIIISPAAINTNPALWGPDAAEFNPERWMAPGCAHTGGADSNYAFLTFLYGPRGCIGQGFSRAEFSCLLAGWVMAYETELDDPALADPHKKLKVVNSVTLRPAGGLKVRIKPVEPVEGAGK